MLKRPIGVAGTTTAMALVACGSVGGGDADFWTPGQGLGTIRFDATGGTGGALQTESGGAEVWQGGGGAPNGGVQAAGGIWGGGANASGGFQGVGGGFGSGGFIDNTGGATGGAVGTGGTNGGTCRFRFDVVTTSYGGRFRPRNVGAIYVLSSGGSFVKTLSAWGTVELHNLSDWEQVSGGNVVDAVTGATRANAGPASGSWDCTDTNHQPVQEGQYQVCCSFQEDDALPFFGPAPKKACVSFTKGAPFTISAPDQGNFTQMTLTMQ